MIKLVCRNEGLALTAKVILQRAGRKPLRLGCAVVAKGDYTDNIAKLQCNVDAYTDAPTEFDLSEWGKIYEK